MLVRHFQRGSRCIGKICHRLSQRRRPLPRRGQRWRLRPRSNRIQEPCWRSHRTRPLRPLAVADDDGARPRPKRKDTCLMRCGPPARSRPNYPSVEGSSPSDSANCAAVRNLLPRPRPQPRIGLILSSQPRSPDCSQRYRPVSYRDSCS